jgi:hypothetical protein
MKKYYIIQSDTRDGEYEYTNIDTFFGEESEIEQFVQDWRGFKGSYQIVKLRSYQEIPKKDYEILRKYSI